MEKQEEINQESPPKKSYGWVIGLVVGIVILILLIVFGISCTKSIFKLTKQATESATQWTEYNSPDGFFKVLFPVTPELSTTTEKATNSDITFKNDSYVSEIDSNIAYMINISFYPKDLDYSDVDGILDGAMNGLVKSKEGNKLISSSKSDFNGNKAIDYELKNDVNKISMKGKIIFVKTDLVQIAVTYKENHYDDANYNKFINSFTLK